MLISPFAYQLTDKTAISPAVIAQQVGFIEQGMQTITYWARISKYGVGIYPANWPYEQDIITYPVRRIVQSTRVYEGYICL